jgi:hypothetical protein
MLVHSITYFIINCRLVRFFLFSQQATSCTHQTAVGNDINLLKPTGRVMHQQFDIQQLYVLPTL